MTNYDVMIDFLGDLERMGEYDEEPERSVLADIIRLVGEVKDQRMIGYSVLYEYIKGQRETLVLDTEYETGRRDALTHLAQKLVAYFNPPF